MRIAILGSRGFPSTYGGYETLVRHLARRWVAEGHDITVYCRSRSESRRRWATEGVQCRWTPGIDSKSLSTLTFGATAHLDAMLQGFDAVLVLNVANGFFLPLLKAVNVPSVLNTDGIEWERGKWSGFAQRVFLAGAHLSARYADLLIADSRAIGDLWQRKFSAASRFIPYGAEVTRDHGTERIEALGMEPERYVLAVARLIPENNIDLLLDALEGADANPCTVIVGSAASRSPLERRLSRLDELKQVRWLGHVSDQELLRELWGKCGVYVHGHSVGGTNPGLLQALGAGAPTLALDTVFNREVLESDEQLFRPNVDELADRITAILDDGTARQRFRERGQSIVLSRYSWPDVIDSYFDALCSVKR